MPESSPYASRLEIFGWAMFDFANSSYTTVIGTVVYAVVFPKLIVGDGPDYKYGNLLWSLALSTSYAIVAMSAPVVGAVVDHTGYKKRWLALSWMLTVIASAALYFGTPEHVWLAFLLVVLSNIGFSIGESFTAAFLPDLGPPESLGKISGMAWGIGYFGGLISTILATLLGPQTPENFENMRLVGPLVGAFFFFAALPTFALLKERGVPRPLPAGQTWLTVGFAQLADTARSLGKFTDLARFFASFIFAMAGLSIVVSFAFIYGDQVIHWQASTAVFTFVIVQLTAAVGALGFGFVQARIGDIRAYSVTLVIWIVTVLLIAGTAPICAALAGYGVNVSAETLFMGVGGCAGLCLGATQSAARTIVALFAPEDRVNEFFGLWGLVGKVAAIFGLLTLGTLQATLGLQQAILLCAVFFGTALLISFTVDGDRGKRVARVGA